MRREVKRGDILSVDRSFGAYQHYAIYVGGDRVIHYSQTYSNNTPKIITSSFDEFLYGEKVYNILDFSKKNLSLTKIQARSSGAIIEEKNNLGEFKGDTYSDENTCSRAYSRLGEDEYALGWSNCEHFAFWCKTGITQSKQIDKLISVFAGISIGSIIIGIILSNYYKNNIE